MPRTAASKVGSGQGNPSSSATDQKRDLSVWLLMALFSFAPAIFALSTYQPVYASTITRHLSVPIVAAELLGIVIMILGGLDLRKAFQRVSKLSKSLVAVWLFFAAIATALAKEHPAFALLLSLTTLTHAIFGLCVWHMLSAQWAAWRASILFAIALGCAIYFAIVLSIVNIHFGDPNYDWAKFGAGVSNVRQLGYYALPLAVIPLAWLSTNELPQRQWIVFAAAVSGCWFVSLSGGRTVFLGYLVVLACLAVISGDCWKRYSLYALAILSGGIACSYIIVPNALWGFDSILGRTLDVGASNYSSNRIDIWIEAIGLVGQSPLVGYGEGQFRFIAESTNGILNHPHNAPLQFAFQWGLIGAFAIILFLTLSYLRALPLLCESCPAARASLALVTGLAIMAMLDGAFYYPYPVWIAVTCLAISSSIATQPRSVMEATRDD